MCIRDRSWICPQAASHRHCAFGTMKGLFRCSRCVPRTRSSLSRRSRSCHAAEMCIRDSGQAVKLRLLEPMQAGNIVVPKNTLVAGTAKVQGERLDILEMCIRDRDEPLRCGGGDHQRRAGKGSGNAGAQRSGTGYGCCPCRNWQYKQGTRSVRHERLPLI